MRKRPRELKMEFIERCLSCEDKKMDTKLCTDLWEEKQLSAVKNIRRKNRNFKKELLQFEKTRVYVDSTNADRVMWNSETLELTIKFLDNSDSIYTYFDVSEDLFNDIIDGNASTKTEGEWGPAGKSPSVGAAIHKYLINRGVKYQKGGTFR